MSTPLVITADEALLDELLRLAAAAGVTPEVAPDPGAALRAWSAAPLVLLGADLASGLVRLAPVRRPGVCLVAWGQAPEELYRLAVAVGAEQVAELPSAEGWVTELLTDLGDTGPRQGFTVGVLGGSGGAGATTFACALGQVAARTGPAVVVDADPLGPGVDRVLGTEEVDGVRWDALCRSTGRLSARSLREALPRREALGVLGWRPGVAHDLPLPVMREALSAARRGHDTVVVDLPRGQGQEELHSRCDLLLVLAVPSVPGLASAARLCARLPDPGAARLVVRGAGADPRQVSRLTGVGVLATMAEQRGLAESIDLGLGPVRSRRGPLARAAAEVLDRIAVTRVAA